jgi:thiol-disulfide isomerase/thioredoxin
MKHDRLESAWEGAARGPFLRWSTRVIGAGLFALVMTVQGPGAQAIDATAPAFDFVTMGGEAYNNASLKGQPSLLIFWAPWCNVCQRELPLMARFHDQGKPSQLRLISIGFADGRRNVEEYVHSHRSTFVFPTAYDVDNDVAQAFKITATPTYVLLDSGGRILLVHRGGGLLQSPHFREFLSTLKG